MDEAHINEKINDVLQGNLREIVSEMTVDQILTNRKQMAVSVVENARVPVIQTGVGVCHVYVHAQADLDIALFAQKIAPTLSITRRFVGTEPFCPITARYNQRMAEELPRYGIQLIQLPRKDAISASRVRQLLRQGRLADIQPLVPETTYAYCRDHLGAGAPCP